MKAILLITLLYTISITVFSQDSLSIKLNELLVAYTKLGKFNGSVFISKGSNQLINKGYGFKDTSKNSINDQNTIYQIASITKQFTATVILKLVELNKMKLTDKLSMYYTGFPNGDIITIQHLLTHTSGIHSFTETDTTIVQTDEKRIIPFIRNLKPDFTPGSDWHYSNSGYVILGYIIQKVSGLSYFQAVRKFIFNPLKMTSSGFDFKHLVSKEKAVGFSRINDFIFKASEITDSTVPFAAGAIYSTVKDMYNWHRGLQSYKIVSKSLMDKAYSPVINHNYGYGWQIDSVNGRKMVSHSGSISGFSSNFARIPEDDICIVLLSNKDGATFDVMHITNRLLAVLYNQPYQMPVKRIPVTLNDSILKKYVGTYEIPSSHLIIEVTLQNSELIAQPFHGPTASLLPLNQTKFFIKQDEETEVTFIIDKSYNSNGMSITQVGKTRLAVKIK